MSRRFDRHLRIRHAAEQQILASVKPKPWWIPKFVWLRMLQLIFR